MPTVLWRTAFIVNVLVYVLLTVVPVVFAADVIQIVVLSPTECDA